jgi:subtilisin family serine protease
MSSSRYFTRLLAVGLLTLSLAVSAALASDRGPVQATAPASAQPDAGIVSSVSEDGQIDGTRVAPPDREGRHLYIVRFAEPSLARYEGGIEGLAATSPRATGQRLNTRSPAAVAYREHLAGRQAAHLEEISRFTQRSLRADHHYLNVLNGVAIRLTPEEARQVAGLPFVTDIQIDTIRELTTDEGPLLIGAPAIWDGQTSSGESTEGEGIIVGILDTGINPDHPSFAATDGDGFTHTNPYGSGNFVGVCDAGNTEQVFDDICNDKLIGAWSFIDGPDSGQSARDWNNHGSHVAATAAGNRHEANFTLGGTSFQLEVSGVAPRANVISYMVCDPGCPGTSSIAAIDQAIVDEVDVLNYSISGSDDPWNDLVDLAFLEANTAGVFVAASAGNDGPGASTVAKTGPWNAAVAASTHQRIFAHPVSLAGIVDPVAGVPGDGPAITAQVQADLRWAGDVDAQNVRGCDAFQAGEFDGEAALIQRGDCTFETKVNNAVNAGAVLVVLYNHVAGPPTAAGGLENTTVPTVMISDVAGQDFVNQLSGSTAQVSIDSDLFVARDEGFQDVMAGFSSRGPSQFNLLAPTFTAPGVNILAAGYASADSYVTMGGTSMSSPHGAGAAALLIAQHPDWTPTEVRSALALTALPETLKEDGLTPSDAFDHGSGRLQLGDAGTIGFVMDETIARFEDANPALGGEPADLNLPSIVQQTCVTECSFERTIRSVLDDPVDYAVTVDAPPGVTITVDPASFTLGNGASQTLEIDIDVTGAPFDEWLFASIHIEEDGSAVGVSDTQMPVLVISREPRPIIEIAPASLSATQERDEVTGQQISIANVGQEPLEWQLNEQGPQNLPGPQVSTVIWDNPQMGTSGRINNFSNADGTGIYQSDAFAILAPSTVETIFSAGFTLGSPGVTGLTWMVFEDNNGVPAGDPETNPQDAIWSFSAGLGDSGVGFVNADMTLDLAAAGAPPLELDPGIYWLIAYPDVDVFSLGPNNLYAWFHGEGGTGRQIGPGGLLGFPATWAGAPEGRAFTLTGTVDCSAEFTPWTNVSPTSGTIAPGQNETVNVEFHSTGMLEGSYSTAFCVLSNDPENPATLMPVQLNVVNLPAASISSTSESFSLEYGDTDSGEFVISNTGLGELEFSVRGGASVQASFRGSSSLIYDQTASQTSSGTLAIHDLDEPEFWAVQAADDFIVPIDENWTIDRVVANGFYAGLVNPASSVRVFFYEDDAGQPGAELQSFIGLAPSADASGVLTFDLPATVSLGGGTYWLSVQPEMDFFGDGRWFWFQNSAQVGHESHWRNPGNGYGSGCTSWQPATECGFNNPDLSFQLYGQADEICEGIDSIAWLSVDPEAGTVAPEGGEQAISLMVNAGAALPGNHVATICFDTNDGANPVLPVEVTLEVTGEAPVQIFRDRFEAQE